ncbi:MAG: hypothetical protein ABH823_04310 [bacterium]
MSKSNDIYYMTSNIALLKSQLPPALTQALGLRSEGLNIFELGLRPSLLEGPQNIKEFIADHGIPNLTKPKDFIIYLKELEMKVGTWRALLTGLMVISDGAGRDLIKEGFEVFDNLRSQVPQPADSERKLNAFFEATKERFTYGNADNGIIQGMKNFSLDPSVEGNEIGSCIVAASIFALIMMSHGFVVGEEHRIERHHSVAIVQSPQAGLFMFSRSPGKPYFKKFELELSCILSSALSFIPALINYQCFLAVPELGPNQPGEKELRALLQRLDLVEALNPYFATLYDLRASIYERLGDREQERINIRFGNALCSWANLINRPVVLPFS